MAAMAAAEVAADTVARHNTFFDLTILFPVLDCYIDQTARMYQWGEKYRYTQARTFEAML